MLEFEYARAALKNGLVLEAKLGVNPYKFGMIGSTDAHTGLAAAEEENFFGKTSAPSRARSASTTRSSSNPKIGVTIKDWELSASGYAASGRPRTPARRSSTRCSAARPTRPPARAWPCASSAAGISSRTTRTPAARRRGYAKGVPMGGDLASAPKGKAPTFLVSALKDTLGANLDRIQIIKGWLDKDGKTQERIYDVAVSGGRKIGADGRCKTPVGNTVDVKNATWTNTIGASELVTVWKDPDFDPALPAFYYARVLEIPTPRWTVYDANRFGIEPIEGTTIRSGTRLHLADLVYAGDVS